jgi:hypothetical protein
VAAPRGLGLFVLAVVVGLVLGSLLGELLGEFAGPGRLKDVLTHGPVIGLTPPSTLDLKLLSVTFGIVFKVNVVGVAGIIVALVLVRRF